jgi:hypothetical protein
MIPNEIPSHLPEYIVTTTLKFTMERTGSIYAHLRGPAVCRVMLLGSQRFPREALGTLVGYSSCVCLELGRGQALKGSPGRVFLWRRRRGFVRNPESGNSGVAHSSSV